jgi:hypothetical protein
LAIRPWAFTIRNHERYMAIQLIAVVHQNVLSSASLCDKVAIVRDQRPAFDHHNIFHVARHFSFRADFLSKLAPGFIIEIAPSGAFVLQLLAYV